MRIAKLRTSPVVTLSIFSTVDSIGGTSPQICISRASRSARLDGLSSPISSPAFICARARATSSGLMSLAARFISSTVICARSRNSPALVPA